MKGNVTFIISAILFSNFIASITYARNEKPDTVVVAFGSCSRQENPDQRWDDILQNKPDLWIWLGDNIYGDTHNMDVLKSKYDLQKKKLWRVSPVL